MSPDYSRLPDPTGYPSGMPAGEGFLAPKPGHHVPRSVVTIGMWLFLASLSMLFIAGLIGYVLVRNLNRQRFNITLHFPALLYVSSALVILVSIAMGRALKSIRFERQGEFKTWLKITLTLATLFLVIQAPAMVTLFRAHLHIRAVALADKPDDPMAGTGIGIYGLVFFLILLHALHVLGGMVALSIVTAKGLAGKYDHETYSPVKHTAMYWHFLDIVWLVMFATFLIAG